MTVNSSGVERCLFFSRNTRLLGTRGVCLLLSSYLKYSQMLWALWGVTGSRRPAAETWCGRQNCSSVSGAAASAAFTAFAGPGISLLVETQHQGIQHHHSPRIYLNISNLISKTLLQINSGLTGTNPDTEAVEVAIILAEMGDVAEPLT